ncbi:MAG: radical SAM peptide maturase [Candidatus Aminicenantes bacterium]|nr:radical SAM peptide maturase [Candidatus Aminicenantes bacterium]
MDANILCKTKAGNNYLYNFNMNRFNLVHPIMNHLLKLAKEGADLEKWREQLPADGIKIDDHTTVNKEEIDYYYQKYLLLLKGNSAINVNREEKFNGKLTEEQVFAILANTIDVIFEATDACNLKCKYCGFGDYYENYDKREKKSLDFKMAANLLDFLYRFWQSPLNTSHKNKINIGFYGGEPLLNIDLIKQVVDYVKKFDNLNKTFTFRMTTNALLLEKNMDFLVDHDFHLLISLDGNKKHNGYRVFPDGSEAYDTIFHNVTALKNKYPDYFKKNISFNVVLHNKNSVGEVYEYFKENFDKIPTISELSPINIKHDKREDFLRMYQNSDESVNLSKDHLRLEKEMFERLPSIKALCSIINHCSGHCYMNYSELLYPSDRQQRIPTGTCLPFSRKLFLSVNGKLLPCERIGHQFFYGTVDEEKVNLDAREVARLTNDYVDKIRNHCFSCYKADICPMCIYNLKVDKPEAIKKCPEFMDYNKFAGYLSSWLSKMEENPEYYPRIMDEVYIS